MSMKNSNDTIWNRTSDIPICSTAPRPNAPPRSPVDLRMYWNARRHIAKDHNHNTAIASVPLITEFWHISRTQDTFLQILSLFHAPFLIPYSFFFFLHSSSFFPCLSISFKSIHFLSFVPLFYTPHLSGYRGGTVVDVLCYKSEGRWFHSRRCHWHHPPDRTMASNTNEYQENFLGANAAGA